DPCESLITSRAEDIELLVMEGTPIFGAAAHEELFASRGGQYTKVRVRGRDMLVSGNPAGLLQKVRAAVGFRKVLDFMPLDT
ncbi:MAG: hydrolase, partial [Acidobacteria bacterium]|nr:hydrolase [Acidobacteriota bacterium]